MRVKLATGLPGLQAQNIPPDGVHMGMKGFIILTESAGTSQPSQMPPRGWHHTDPHGQPSLSDTSEADEPRGIWICKAPKESPGIKATTRG